MYEYSIYSSVVPILYFTLQKNIKRGYVQDNLRKLLSKNWRLSGLNTLSGLSGLKTNFLSGHEI